MREKRQEKWSGLNNLKWHVAYKGILAGLIAGLLVSLYRVGIEFGVEKSAVIYQQLRQKPAYTIVWLAAAILVAAIAQRLMRLEPYAKGSGIPQVEGIVLLGMKIKWYTVLAVRFVVGILTSFFGLSLGREGPSIQIGAAGSQAAAKKISSNKLEENYLITAGASAGLSAAFNAPLSGIVFALEEVHRSFSPNILIAATTAALTSDMVSKYFFGLTPVLSYGDIPQLPIPLYILLLPAGIVSGLIGAAINKALLAFSALYLKIPAFCRPLVALLPALPCGLFLPQVLGGGQGLIKLSETGQAGIALLCLYLVIKALFTCTSFGSGLPGGIFMPILSIGALSGGILGRIFVRFGMDAAYIPVFCVCAMAGAMAGSVKAPVTSILLMAEMTGSLIHLLPVAAVAFTALLVSDLLKVSPIYEVLLEQLSGDDRAAIREKSTGAVIEVPVELGSSAAGRKIKEVAWPDNTLIISIHRGAAKLVPNGDEVIFPGDYLMVLSSEQEYESMNRALTRLCKTG